MDSTDSPDFGLDHSDGVTERAKRPFAIRSDVPNISPSIHVLRIPTNDL